MKKDVVLSSGFLIILVILIAGAAFLPTGAAQTIIGSARFEPKRFDLTYGFGVSVVEGTIRFPSGKGPTVKDINCSTILLEGSLPPSSTYRIPGGLVCRYDATLLEYIVWAKLYHVGVTEIPKKIWLTTYGSLNQTAGGTAFEAAGDIKIIIPNSPSPP